DALLGEQAGHTSLTRGFTGRLARGIHNRLLEQLNQSGAEVLPYPLQRALVRNVATAAEAAGRSDLVPLWAGQSAPLLRFTDVQELLNSLIEQVTEVLSSYRT
ncbi:MAG TPA: nitronate monooxygenase, partial [Gemmatimonadales bacterium]|nr:nitronate monooxygenase [Gemmatimonadales bacterium]